MEFEEIRNIMRTYILENFLFGYKEDEVDCDISLLDMGVIDSTGIIELVLFIEEIFGIEIPDIEILPDNLDSINCICNYINRKQNAA